MFGAYGIFKNQEILCQSSNLQNIFKKSIRQSQLLIPVQFQQLAMLMVATIFRWAPGLWFLAVFPSSTHCAVEDSLLQLKAWGTFHSENELMPQIFI